MAGKVGGQRDARKGDSRGDFNDEESRSRELNRLRGSGKQVIEAELESRFDGGYHYEGYGGEECRRSDACMAICDGGLIPNNTQKRCYRSPKNLVEDLEEGFFNLLNISEVDSVNISPGLLAGMLDMNLNMVADLVEDRMSEGDLKSFLAWVAVNESIAYVFLEEDKRSKIMEKAFKELGEHQEEANKKRETGLNLGLIHKEDSFFYLSAVKDNAYGFQIAYEVLESACSSKNCKIDLLCARETLTGRRYRNLGYGATEFTCRTSAERRRRSRPTRDSICYIHGAAVWSYLTELIDERKIRDKDFKGENNAITVQTCNNYCGSRDSDKCKRIF